MDTVLVLGGSVVVAAVFVDAFMTTLAVAAGAGPLTSRVLGLCWRVLLRLHRQDKESSFLTAAGTLLLSVTVLTWVAALWAGWSLVFAGSDAIIGSTSRRPADMGDVVYYAGFTVFTLGTGDFVASTTEWRIVTAFASFCGLFLVTLSITYLISVVSAVVARRALAVQIHGMGLTSGEIVAHGWTGDHFGSMFQQQLVSLGADIAVTAEQHLAYPVLHYFHSRTRMLAAPSAIAALDDALTIIQQGVPPDRSPERSAVVPLQSAITRYVVTATAGTTWVPDAGPAPSPDLHEPAAAGVPLLPEARSGEIFRRAEERRTDLHRLVLSDGWSWSGSARTDRTGPDDTGDPD